MVNNYRLLPYKFTLQRGSFTLILILCLFGEASTLATSSLSRCFEPISWQEIQESVLHFQFISPVAHKFRTTKTTWNSHSVRVDLGEKIPPAFNYPKKPVLAISISKGLLLYHDRVYTSTLSEVNYSKHSKREAVLTSQEKVHIFQRDDSSNVVKSKQSWFTDLTLFTNYTNHMIFGSNFCLKYIFVYIYGIHFQPIARK